MSARGMAGVGGCNRERERANGGDECILKLVRV